MDTWTTTLLLDIIKKGPHSHTIRFLALPQAGVVAPVVTIKIIATACLFLLKDTCNDNDLKYYRCGYWGQTDRAGHWDPGTD